jgi:ribosome-binding protein aMBF1 (putative translation factor)
VQLQVACGKTLFALQYNQEVTAMDTKEILLKLRTKSGFSQDELAEKLL